MEKSSYCSNKKGRKEMSKTKIILLIVGISGVAPLILLAVVGGVLVYLAVDQEMDKDDFLKNGKRGTAKILKVSDKTTRGPRG
jgi:uncharacterized membrane protein